MWRRHLWGLIRKEVGTTAMQHEVVGARPAGCRRGRGVSTWYLKPLVPCVVPLLPCVVALLPCVVPLVPCAVPLVPCVVPLVPCVVPLLPCGSGTACRVPERAWGGCCTVLARRPLFASPPSLSPLPTPYRTWYPYPAYLHERHIVCCCCNIWYICVYVALICCKKTPLQKG